MTLEWERDNYQCPYQGHIQTNIRTVSKKKKNAAHSFIPVTPLCWTRVLQQKKKKGSSDKHVQSGSTFAANMHFLKNVNTHLDYGSYRDTMETARTVIDQLSLLLLDAGGDC